MSSSEKASCFFPPNRECPSFCPGLNRALGGLVGEYSVELCQNPQMEGSEPFILDPGDDGPVIITIYGKTSPQYRELVQLDRANEAKKLIDLN